MQVELSTQGEKMRSSVVIVLGLLIPGAAHCEVPAFVTYSGRLTDGTGWGESTEATLVFRLYDSATGGTPFWATTHPDVPVVDGYFTVNLGMCNADGSACTVNPAEATFPGDIPDQMWVGVEVGGVELERQPVGSVPYALYANRSVRVENPHCSSEPCTNDDLLEVVAPYSLQPGTSEFVVAYCPKDVPIPVTGGCWIQNHAGHLYVNFPSNWNHPQDWESSLAEKRAKWTCNGHNTSSSQTVLMRAYIVCRKK